MDFTLAFQVFVIVCLLVYGFFFPHLMDERIKTMRALDDIIIRDYKRALDEQIRRADHYKNRCRKLRSELHECREILSNLCDATYLGKDDKEGPDQG